MPPTPPSPPFQILFALPEFALLSTSASSIIASSPADPTTDLLTQLAKLATAMLGNRYVPGGDGAEPASEPPAEAAVAPRMLKALLGRGHPEFSTGRQQDAFEYLMHLVEATARAERAGSVRLGAGGRSLAGLFSFVLEERVQVDGQVSYQRVPSQRSISLQVPRTRLADPHVYFLRCPLPPCPCFV